MGRRAAVVTGGSGVIGAAVVRRLMKRNIDVLAVDLHASSADGAGSTQPGRGRVFRHAADVTRPEAATAIADFCREKFGRADILINVAGGAGPNRVNAIETIELDLWNSVLELNVQSAFLMSRALVPMMRIERYGRIINFSSVVAVGENGPSTTVSARLPYATAKAALLGFTKQLAKDEAAYGITVNALMPALIMGDIGTRIRDRFENLSTETRGEVRRRWPSGRHGDPEEVAAAVDFLASEEASYISGVALPIDGAML